MIFNMLFKLLTIYIVLCLPSSGIGFLNHGKKIAGHRILKKESFGLNKTRDNRFEESPGFKVQEINGSFGVKQESKLKYHNEHEKKKINKYRRSIPVRFPRRIHDNDKRYNATSRTGLAHLAKAVISDIKKLEDKYQVSVSGVAKIHQRMMNNFGNYTWRHAALPGGGYISQHDIAPSKPKVGKQHKSFKPNPSHDKRGKVHKKEKIVTTINPPLTYKPLTYKSSTYKPSIYKPSTYKPFIPKTTTYPTFQMEFSTKNYAPDDEDIKFGSFELTDTSTPNIKEEKPTTTSELKHPAKKYIFNNDEFESKDTYQPSQFRLKPYRYYRYFHHDFKPQHDHHFSHNSETSTHKIYPSSYATTESSDQRAVLTENVIVDSTDATPIIEFESNESDETSAEKNISNNPNFDDVDEPPSNIVFVPSPTSSSTDKKSDGIPVIELFVSNQSQIVSPNNQNHTGYFVVYEPPEGIALHDTTSTTSYTSVQESDVPDTIPQILNIEMIRPESNMDYSESTIFFPEENQNEEMDPCQNRGSIQISLFNLGLPCGDISDNDDNSEDLYKREFALNLTNVFYDYLEKEKGDREDETPLDIDIRAGRRRRASDKEKKKDKKETPSDKKAHNKKDLKNGSVFGEILDVPNDLSNNNSNEYFNLSLLSDYFLEAVDSLDEASLIEVLVALREDFLSNSPSDQIIVDEVYDKLVASLLEYKRSKHNLVERKKRESPKKGRSEAASFLELLAETDRLIGSEQQDDPLVNDYYSDNTDADEGLESNENPSFLELVSLADKHKSRI